MRPVLPLVLSEGTLDRPPGDTVSSSKHRRKARRRAERWMTEAWEAVLHDDLVLAEKLSRRAIELGQVNPRLWLDHGRVLVLCDELDEAGEALRRAIALAPTFGEAFAELARFQASVGKIVQAERLQARAVELAAQDAEARLVLESYRALLPARGEAEPGEVCSPVVLTARTQGYDWEAVAADLRAHGMARLPGLLSVEEYNALIALWDDFERFEHEVAYDSETEGKVEYRFFASPLPDVVAALRAEVYACAAVIANAWHEVLGRRDRFPPVLENFLAHCREAGQYRSTPILLRYEAGGFNAPHRDIAGKVVFPLQLAVTLGPGCSDDGGGGELVLTDQLPGKRVRQHSLPTSVGDGVLFCTRERLVDVAGAVGLQGVMHGVSPTEGLRFALGVPFHDHG